MRRVVLCVIACVVIALPQSRSILGLLTYTELKAYLQLSDDQLWALRQIQREEEDSLGPTYQQIADKVVQIQQLLATRSPDPVQIGELGIDIAAAFSERPPLDSDLHLPDGL